MSEKVITVDMTLQLTFFRLKVSFISYSANFYLEVSCWARFVGLFAYQYSPVRRIRPANPALPISVTNRKFEKITLQKSAKSISWAALRNAWRNTVRFYTNPSRGMDCQVWIIYSCWSVLPQTVPTVGSMMHEFSFSSSCPQRSDIIVHIKIVWPKASLLTQLREPIRLDFSSKRPLNWTDVIFYWSFLL